MAKVKTKEEVKNKVLKKYAVSASPLVFYEEIEIEAESEQEAKDIYYEMLEAGKIKAYGRNCENDDIDCEEVDDGLPENIK